MSTQTIGAQVRWQDLKVRSELDLVLEIAKQAGWEDCEVFGYGDMLTQPQVSLGWELIPADLYKYSIPAEAVARLHQLINAGIRVQGVIIADDQRHEQPTPTPAPARPRVSLPSVQPIVSWMRGALLGFIHAVASFFGKALLGLIRAVGEILSFSWKAVLGLIRVAGTIAIVALAAYVLIRVWPIALIGCLGLLFAGSSYDPKLIILVDDGNGGTVWVSLFTWYD